MTARTARNPILIALLSTVAGFLMMFGLAMAVAAAQGPPDPSVEISAVDAGVADPGMAVETHLDGNGPQVALAVNVTPAQTAEVSAEPSAEDLAMDGRWAALAVALTIGLRKLSKYVKSSSALAFLRRGRWPAIVGGVTAVGVAVADVLLTGGTWTAVALAAFAAGVAYVDGFGADEDKPKAGAAGAV